MILLCDEDVGTGVPKALALVDYDVKCLVGLKCAGRPDKEWLALAGQKEWLVFSCNKKMLLVPEEHDTIVNEKVGVVFLTTGEEHPRGVLRLLLNRWDKLEFLWNTTKRPFVRFLSSNGRLAEKYKHYPVV